jgi:hypothetical protein
MGFTTPAFIRKNTPNLRKKLTELGYKVGNETYINDDFLAIDNNEMFGIDKPYLPEQCGGYIHCGTNESLFLAIAALRENTDKFQWFTDGDKWILCPEIKFSVYWVYNDIDVNIGTIHKATVNELIEHFKEGEE